ncbi:MAG: aldehyde dehydrogenase family protein [Candidatus Odinarchaeum yellowstonii]|uniref:long-chain-fatty-acyl-CoA reductase n=1 Tax=Odinarchaeota yellowstonii (strain LCB_4) TaxID=1841599 RepID=A0AAF0IC78_ODILC|nr:MAG: aldehyde dehydrogenase family protein [Candidatus Odinarchaeum yellowstonii]
MELKPLTAKKINDYTRKKVGEIEVLELSEKSLDEILKEFKSIQSALSKTPIENRLKTFNEVGLIWRRKLDNGELENLKKTLSELTGYSESLVELEFNLVSYMLSEKNIRSNLEAAFSKGIQGLWKFTKIAENEYYKFMPAGPVFIVSSGNSMIPPLIPTTLSLVTGNLTILKPSISNYLGVVEVYKSLEELSKHDENAAIIFSALVISYFAHDSPVLKYLLTKTKLGVVNFWGADPARIMIAKLVAENQNHPRLVINGPLTGLAIIDAESANTAAKELALNIVLYDQQLCSSPTQAVFIGRLEEAISFAENVGRYLDAIGEKLKMKTKEGSLYLLQSARRALQLKGVKVLFSNNRENPWTIVVSKDKSSLEFLSESLPEFNIYNRRRFIEIIVVEKATDAFKIIESVTLNPAFKDVDKIQSIGLALSDSNKNKIIEELPATGIYRITSLADMYMRSPLEPYDGASIPSLFTYTVYRRDVKHPYEITDLF